MDDQATTKPKRKREKQPLAWYSHEKDSEGNEVLYPLPSGEVFYETADAVKWLKAKVERGETLSKPVSLHRIVKHKVKPEVERKVKVTL